MIISSLTISVLSLKPQLFPTLLVISCSFRSFKDSSSSKVSHYTKTTNQLKSQLKLLIQDTEVTRNKVCNPLSNPTDILVKMPHKAQVYDIHINPNWCKLSSVKLHNEMRPTLGLPRAISMENSKSFTVKNRKSENLNSISLFSMWFRFLRHALESKGIAH